MKLSPIPESPFWYGTDDGSIIVMRDYNVKTDHNVYKVTIGLNHPDADRHNVTIKWEQRGKIELEELVRRGRKAIDSLIQGS